MFIGLKDTAVGSYVKRPHWDNLMLLRVAHSFRVSSFIYTDDRGKKMFNSDEFSHPSKDMLENTDFEYARAISPESFESEPTNDNTKDFKMIDYKAPYKLILVTTSPASVYLMTNKERLGKIRAQKEYALKVTHALYKKIKDGDIVVCGDNTRIANFVVTRKLENTLVDESIQAANEAKGWAFDIINAKPIIKLHKDDQRRQFLLNELKERKEAFEETKMLELMAASDPKAAELLNELKQLGM